MAARPWVTPERVRSYTDIEAVAGRSDEKLGVDIALAEQYVISYTRNDFSDVRYATSVPKEVQLAVMVLAEAYARRAVEQARQSGVVAKTGMKSEAFDDYSYSVADVQSRLDIESLNLPALLDGYVLEPQRGSVTMRLRKL